MKLIDNYIYQITGTTAGAIRVALYCLVVSSIFICLTSCRDEVISPDSDHGYGNNGFTEQTIDLPGVVGVNVMQVGIDGTRAEGDDNQDPSMGGTLEDGEDIEFGIAPGKGNHYILIYKAGEGSLTPMVVMPLEFPEENIESSDLKNITLIAKSAVVSASDMTGSNIGSLENFKNVVDNNEIYLLLNFDKSEINAADNLVTITEDDTNGTVLNKIKRDDFLNKLKLTDYRITLKDGEIVDHGTSGSTDYFTMTNSVYISNNQLCYGFSTNVENISLSETTAANNPAISVYAERLATKYTVKFETNAVSSGQSDEVDGEEEIEGDVIVGVGENDLPSYTLTKYLNLYSGWNFDSENSGYSINSDSKDVTIKVLGVGVSNLEKSEYLLKNIDNTTYFPGWNDAGTASNHRSYWSKDPNYKIEKATQTDVSGAIGYPHQFRPALETDSVTSLFKNEGSGYKYDNRNHFYDDVTVMVNGTPHTTRYFLELGSMNYESLNKDCFLTYRSFKDLLDDYNDNIGYNSRTGLSGSFYSLENTIWDPGMKINTTPGQDWSWEWRRAPYSTATNFMLLCQISIQGVTSGKTLYRGQNNIFYHELYDQTPGDKTGVITSKLEILNEVMLNGGNAGFQIFDGKWDSHDRGTMTTILDKIAWNENGVVWLGEANGTNSDGTVKYDYRRMIDTDFELIPAELAGGDGQALIAPKERWMGKDYRYFIAPEKRDDSGNLIKDENDKTIIDDKSAVEISFNHLVGLIHKIIGPIDVFVNGYTYYSVPVSHNEQSFKETSTDKSESWRTLGNVGVVRNNWYEITVKDVTGIGTPVHAVDQPIVPVMDVRRSYLNLGVKLLKWHELSQGQIPMD